MKFFLLFFLCCLLYLMTVLCVDSYGQNNGYIPPLHRVTLPEAHKGDLATDTRLLDSYGRLPDSLRQFYLEARSVFTGHEGANFSHPDIIKAAAGNGLQIMSGPMLGQLKEDGITLWLRPSGADPLKVTIVNRGDGSENSFIKTQVEPGVEQRIAVNGLNSSTEYTYAVYIKDCMVAEGRFKTAPPSKGKYIFRVAFGSCFHKIGLHNSNLVNQILKREPDAMMLLGDIAVDDRENNINMHRADYQLRDVSFAWRQLAANVPLYASWDDHDYLNNDLSGVPEPFTKADREALRAVWRQNWNNPENEAEGIYFNTTIGPVELIMLDTRSCRIPDERGQYGSYLGMRQLGWLKETLKKSAAPVKIISSGTMWSDYITNGKDSWGTWDTLGREEIFNFIEEEKITGVLLVSGDRHGARGFRIPRQAGDGFYEFEPASLGGVPGPDAMAPDSLTQLFGYHGTDMIGFGEFTVDSYGEEPSVTFRLIDQHGNVKEEYLLELNDLKPVR